MLTKKGTPHQYFLSSITILQFTTVVHHCLCLGSLERGGRLGGQDGFHEAGWNDFPVLVGSSEDSELPLKVGAAACSVAIWGGKSLEFENSNCTHLECPCQLLLGHLITVTVILSRDTYKEMVSSM